MGGPSVSPKRRRVGDEKAPLRDVSGSMNTVGEASSSSSNSTETCSCPAFGGSDALRCRFCNLPSPPQPRLPPHLESPLAIPPCSLLQPGVTFRGTQRLVSPSEIEQRRPEAGREWRNAIANRKAWKVEVTIHSVNLARATISGFMTAIGVRSGTGSVTTFWEGQILDARHYGFRTGRWRADDRVDAYHWSRFGVVRDSDILRRSLPAPYSSSSAPHHIYSTAGANPAFPLFPSFDPEAPGTPYADSQDGRITPDFDPRPPPSRNGLPIGRNGNRGGGSGPGGRERERERERGGALSRWETMLMMEDAWADAQEAATDPIPPGLVDPSSAAESPSLSPSLSASLSTSRRRPRFWFSLLAQDRVRRRREERERERERERGGPGASARSRNHREELSAWRLLNPTASPSPSGTRYPLSTIFPAFSAGESGGEGERERERGRERSGGLRSFAQWLRNRDSRLPAAPSGSSSNGPAGRSATGEIERERERERRSIDFPALNRPPGRSSAPCDPEEEREREREREEEREGDSAESVRECLWDSDCVLMRWKETIFVHQTNGEEAAAGPSTTNTPNSFPHPPPTHFPVSLSPSGTGERDEEIGRGVTIAGFYYVCLNRRTGTVEGYYYDPNTRPLQKLELSCAMPGDAPYRSGDVELR